MSAKWVSRQDVHWLRTNILMWSSNQRGGARSTSSHLTTIDAARLFRGNEIGPYRITGFPGSAWPRLSSSHSRHLNRGPGRCQEIDLRKSNALISNHHSNTAGPRVTFLSSEGFPSTGTPVMLGGHGRGSPPATAGTSTRDCLESMVAALLQPQPAPPPGLETD